MRKISEILGDVGIVVANISTVLLFAVVLFCIFLYENVYYLITFKIVDPLGYPPITWELHQKIRFLFTGERDHISH